jgi:hypothetical protein
MAQQRVRGDLKEIRGIEGCHPQKSLGLLDAIPPRKIFMESGALAKFLRNFESQNLWEIRST